MDRISAGTPVHGTQAIDVSRINGGVITIVASPIPTLLKGVAHDQSSHPCSGLAIIVSSNRKMWTRDNEPYWWAARLSTAGDFELRGLPPGRYCAFHEPPRRPSEIGDPGYLQQKCADAKVITIESQVLDASLSCR